MADENEIRQEMVLDASETLKALLYLNEDFRQLGTRLNEVSGQMGYFNSNAGKTVAALKQIADEARRTHSALRDLAKGVNVPSVSSGAVRPSGARRGASPAGLPDIEMESRAEQLLKLGNVHFDTSAAERATAGAKSAGAAAEEAAGKTKSWVLSWQTLARVIQTQLIVRSLNMIRDAFEESYESNIKFVKTISEIRAIDPSRNFSQIAASVRQLSDSFNQPIAEVAEAQYQAISNQFVTAADHANILTAANALSKVTAQDLGTAVSLVTGTLNAYGESSEMAGVRSAQFFEAVALGHFRMNDLATAMGRTQTIGHELGVEMEELEAALITVTIGGVKANEAATQIRGIMSALLKPSEALTAALHSIGAESGPAAIATWKFGGTLEKLRELTHGNAAEMAALFPNVRGLAGALRIAGEGAEQYAKSLDRVYEAANQERLKSGLAETIATDAAKVTAELNKVKNFFTVDFGASVVKEMQALIGSTDKWVAAINPLLTDLMVLGPVAGGLTAGVYLLSKSFTGVSMEALTARTSVLELKAVLENPVKSALGLAALFEGARIAGSELGEYLYKSWSAQADATSALLANNLSLVKQHTESALREDARKNKLLLQGVRQYLAEAGKEHLKHQESVKAAAKVEEQVMKLAFDHIMEDRRKMTQELQSMSEAAAKKAQEEIPKDIRGIRRQQEDRNLENDLSGRSPESQFAQAQDAYRRSLRQAEIAQAGAKDKGEEEEAAAWWKQVETRHQLMTGAAQQLGTTNAIKEAEEAIWQIENRKIAALERQQELQQAIADEAEERHHQAEGHNNDLEERRRLIEETMKTTVKDEEGGKNGFHTKTPEVMKKDLETAAKMRADFQEKLQEYSGEDFAKPFFGDVRAFESLQRQAERALASQNVEEIALAPDKIAGFFDSLKTEAKKVELEIPVIARIERVTGMDLATHSANELFTQFAKDRTDLVTEQAQRDEAQRKIALARVAYREHEAQYEAVSRGPLATFRGGRVAGEMNTLAGADTISDEQWQRFVNKIAPQINAAGLQERPILNQMMGDLALRRDTQNKTPALNAEKEARAQEIGSITEELGVWKSYQDGAAATSKALSDETDAIKANTAAWADLRAKYPNANISNELPGGHCLGGLIRHFADGGASGTDIIPAMLSPGEMVINAASSRQFAAQLIAMNAGIKPIFRSEGGQTTNIGDINVSVTGGETSRHTARSIATELRRELRRGISQL